MDEVVGLGPFLEFEAVVGGRVSDDDLGRQVEKLTGEFRLGLTSLFRPRTAICCCRTGPANSRKIRIQSAWRRNSPSLLASIDALVPRQRLQPDSGAGT